MTEELQDGQQLSDGDKAAEKPAQDNPDQETEQKKRAAGFFRATRRRGV